MGWFNLIMALVAVFVVPLVGAKYLCRIWRMPNYFWRFTWTLFAFMFGLTVIFQSWMNGWKDVKLGIDLRGGTILVYQVKGIGTEGITQEMDSPEASQSKINMEELTVALRRRVDPDSVKDVTIRALGHDQVEIIIPEVDEDEVAMLKRKIASVGTLEFRITANQRDHADIIEIAQQTPGRVVRSADGKETLGWWIPVAAESDTNFAGGGFIWREGKEEGKDILEVLVVNDDFNVQGGYLESATASFDGFNPIVEFRFNAVGASLFRGLTSANQPVPNPQNPNNPFTRQLGIILDGYLQSAPSLQAVISDRGQISGGFTQEKTEELAGILKAGRLPAVLGKIPSSEMTTGPTLGMDTIERAKYAILVSILLIMAIMLYYYRFSGVVAVVSLLLLMMLTFAIMVSINAAFTLPGLAGLVLTVGMAVDANILIYERLREEYLEGNAIGVCVRNGFSKALSAIVDSNLTTLIVASILFWIGTEQIRGFAIILWIGIVISMFSAIYVGRTIFDVAIQRGWLKEIRMHRILPPTHFPFMSYARQTLTVSGILMLLCVVAVFARVKGVGNASSLFDIDFSGGNTVQVLFNDAQTEAGIYDRLEDDFQDLTVTDVTLMTDEANNMLFRRYNITTTSPKDKEASVYLEEIQAKLKERFAGELKTNKMTFEVKSNAVASATPVAPLDATSLENAAPAVETPAPAPAENATPAVETPAPAPVENAAPAVETPAPAPVENATPAVETPAPAPVENATPAVETPAPAPVENAAPAVETPAPAPVENAAPAVETPAPAPVENAAPAVETQSYRLRPVEQMYLMSLFTQTAETNPAPVAETPATPAESAPVLTGAPAESNVAELPTQLDLSAKQTTVTLHFEEAITGESVSSLVAAKLDAMEKRGILFDVVAPEAEENARRFHDWTIHIDLPAEEVTPIFAEIQKDVNTTPVFPSCTTIGSQVASSTCLQGLVALMASLLGIIAYIWIRFQKVSYGLASCAGLVHNVVIALGLIAISTWIVPVTGWLMITDFKISLTILAAFLTLIGYSLNDTIIVFDRIREVRGKDPQLTKEVINKSLNQTLARTVMTSLTTFIVSVALYIWGGQTIHGFAFVMTSGIIIGTYASLFVATPLLYWMVGKYGSDD